MTDTVRVPRAWLEAFHRDTDPNEPIADNGGTVWDMFCHEAAAMLAASPQHEAGEWAELLEWHRERASEARSREAAHDEADAPACAARAHGDAEFHESAVRMLAASPQGEGLSGDPAPIKPSGDTGELRERVAKIVDPAGFDDRWDVPGLRHEASLDERVDEALAKADAILDLIQSERAG